MDKSKTKYDVDEGKTCWRVKWCCKILQIDQSLYSFFSNITRTLEACYFMTWDFAYIILGAVFGMFLRDII